MVERTYDSLTDALIRRASLPARTPEQRELLIDELVTMAGHREELLETAVDELRRRSHGDARRAEHALRMFDGAIVRARTWPSSPRRPISRRRRPTRGAGDPVTHEPAGVSRGAGRGTVAAAA